MSRNRPRRPFRPPAGLSPRFRPRLEALEDRTAPAVTEFPILTASSGPTDIALAADGNLWFTEFNADRIGRITPAGAITEFPLTAGVGPLSITAGPDGRLYFTERFTDRIGRLNPLAGSNAAIQASLVEFMVPGAGSGPTGITVGPDAKLWFTEFGSDEIGRLTTAGILTEFVVPGAGSGPAFITAGPDGALWFTEAGSAEIGRITTAGVVTNEFVVPGATSDPEGITAGPDGALWFTELGSDQIGRITTAGARIEFPLAVGSAPNRITSGPDGRLYFTEGGPDRIGRITTIGTVAELTTGITAGAQPSGVAFGADGALWFTENSGNRIGRATLTDGATIATAAGPLVATFNSAGGIQRVFAPFGPRFGNPLALAVGDVNGDGAPDIIVTPAKNGPPAVGVFSGKDGSLLRALPGFKGGVSLTAGDINADGFADILLGITSGGPPLVAVFSGRSGAVLKVFAPFPPGFKGGVTVAAGDINGDGFGDVLVTPAKGPAVVAAFSGKDGSLLRAFFPFGAVPGALSLAAGDVSGDGVADIIAGLALNRPGFVAAFNGKTGALLNTFFPFGVNFGGGVLVAAEHANGDRFADIVVAPATGKPAAVVTFSGAGGSVLGAFLALPPGVHSGFVLTAGEREAFVPPLV
jgi:virginiamycin B lyase